MVAVPMYARPTVLQIGSPWLGKRPLGRAPAWDCMPIRVGQNRADARNRLRNHEFHGDPHPPCSAALCVGVSASRMELRQHWHPHAVGWRWFPHCVKCEWSTVAPASTVRHIVNHSMVMSYVRNGRTDDGDSFSHCAQCGPPSYAKCPPKMRAGFFVCEPWMRRRTCSESDCAGLSGCEPWVRWVPCSESDQAAGPSRIVGSAQGHRHSGFGQWYPAGGSGVFDTQPASSLLQDADRCPSRDRCEAAGGCRGAESGLCRGG